MAHTFEELVNLEHAAQSAHTQLGAPDVDYNAQWVRWRDAAAAFQAAVTTHAQAEDTPRVEVEMAVKKAVRHPAPTE